MRARGGAAVALAAALWLTATAGPGAARAQHSERAVVGVDLIASAGVPESLVRSAIGELVGRPRSRGAVRESLERLWALGLFADIIVEEIDAPEGIRLRYDLTPRPLVRRIAWQGDAGLDLTQLVAAASLALGEEASPGRLAHAREDLLALYRREGYLDARVEIETVSISGEAGQQVTIILSAGTPVRLEQVRLEGSLGLPQKTVTQTLGLGTGDRYREATVRDRVRALEERLRREGFFEARATARPPTRGADTQRIDLTVDVAAGRRYAVTFVGRRALAESALRDRLTLRDSGTVDEFEVEASARQLEALYRERGYTFAHVTGSLDGAADPPAIRFAVTEGPEVRVAAVTFDGNAALAAKQLRARIATRPAGLLEKGLFRQDVLDRDVTALQAFARTQGFADATVGPAAVQFDEGRARAHIVIPVVEGPRVRVEHVDVEGQTLFTTAEILAAIPVVPRDPWNPARIEEGRRGIERLYARRGYHGATADADVTRRDREVSVIYRIAEGPQTRIGRILLRGLAVTKEETVRRQLGFEPGDVFDPERLGAARQRLERPPAFATVDVGPLRPRPAPFADAEVLVAEQKPWRFELGVGYDTAVGFNGYLELSHDNLFGTARSGGIRVTEAVGGEAIKRLDHVDLIYREPWIPGTPWQGQIDLYGERSENLGYDLERVGFLAWIGDDLLNPRGPQIFRSQLRYRLEGARVSDVSPDLQAEGIEPGTDRIGSLTPVVMWDFRDDRFNPRRGSLHRASLETAHPALGGNVEFAKAELSTSWFFSWLPPTVFAVSGRLGLATPFGGTQSLPIADRFFTGGSTSVRGFPENRLGPRDAAGNPVGGEALAVLSAEWRFPLWRWVSGAAFVDAGTVTPEVGDLSFSAFKSGAGAGLRVATPVGPIRFDVAYALQPIPGEDRLQLYLTVGFPF
jgi:outer membrane protein insertion porin family